MKKIIIFGLLAVISAANLGLVNQASALGYCELYYGSPCYQLTNNGGSQNGSQSPAVAFNGSGNRAPIWTNNQTAYSVVAGNRLEFPMGAYDPDNDAVTLFASFLPVGANYNDFTQYFGWNTASHQAGTYTVRFTATDGRLYSYKDVAISVQQGQPAPGPISNPNPAPTPTPIPAPVNNPPQFVNFLPTGVGKVNQLYAYDVNAIDADNDFLTYSLLSNPNGMFINSATGYITWVPTASQTGFNFVSVAVSDGKSQNSRSFQIFVDAPVVISNPTPLPPVTPGPVVPQNPAEAKIVFSDIKFEIVDGEVYVNWKTNLPSGSRVIWDTASQSEKTANFTYANATSDDRDPVTNHRVRIGKLEAGAVHYLRLVSKTDRQTAVSQEIAFVELSEGRISAIFGANLFELLGNLLGSPAFLWLIIIALGIFGFLMYRRNQKTVL